MSGIADLVATGPRVELGTLPAAALSALGGDAVVVIEPAGADSVVLAAEGLDRAEAAAVAHAWATSARSSQVTQEFEAPGFEAALWWEARVPPDASAALCVLRRASGAFERISLGGVFAQHAAWTIALHRRAAPPAPQDDDDGGAAGPAGLFDVADWESMVTAVVDEARRLVGARTAGILAWDPRAGSLQLLRGSFGAAPETAASARVAPIDWWSSAARVFSTGQPYVANDVAADRGLLREYMDALGVTRMASVALETGGRRVGVLELANKPEAFTTADLAAASRLASRFAPAVDVARRRFALERRLRLEEILGRIAVDIAAGRSLQEFLGPALDDLCHATDAALLAVVPRVGEPVVWRRGPERRRFEHIVMEEGHHAARLRSHVVASRGPGDAGWAVLHVPIRLDDERIATLSALRGRGEEFDHDERRALARLANLTALAWSTERYQRHHAQLARVAERERIADELHDHIAQLLFAARLSLDSALEVAGVPAAAASSVQRARDVVLRGDGAIRQVIQQLARPADGDLASQLAATLGGVEEEFGHPVQLDISRPAAEAARRLGPSRTSLLTKVAREALVNAAKHAGPCQLTVRLTLTRRGRLLLAISDDGIGFVDRRRDAGYGLAALRRAVRQHGGQLRVQSAPTGGTSVSVSLPL